MKTLQFMVVMFFLTCLMACSGSHKSTQPEMQDYVSKSKQDAMPMEMETKKAKTMSKEREEGVSKDEDGKEPEFNTESYNKVNENPFLTALHNPVSTFGVDVDKASYSNVRRYLNQNTLPPVDAVRLEELINYFDYNYPQPTDKTPFSINMEMGKCPWNNGHYLVSIGLKGKETALNEIPPANLVFLLDVSGSMDDPQKLPLLKQAFKILVNQLRPTDRIAIVVYAGAAGLVLPSTECKDKEKILDAMDKLQAGGSTAGGAGINLAYKVGKENFIKNGNNRVIIATDGDFNIGASSDSEMERLIEEKRKDGIFLTVLGFGMGNYKDSKMVKLADAGNGNYAYIDNLLEAKKVLGHEMWRTLYTIAKDVKIQVEFNPQKIKGYRLIGYEKRLLRKEDFNDDTKDAGEIGAGHTVTALYEIIMADSKEVIPDADKLEYQKTEVVKSDNLMTVKLRYKQPDGDKSELITQHIKAEDINRQQQSENFRFAAAVTQYGLLLRNSEHKGNASFENARQLAKSAMGQDPFGIRAEFLKLLEIAETLKK